MNKFLNLVLLNSLILIAVSLCSAQIQNGNAQVQIEDAPPAPKKPAGRKGNATVYYYEKENRTHALVQSYIDGSIEGDYQHKDAIRLNVDYSGEGKPPIRPKFVDFWIQFASKDENKHKDNHKIIIFADDKALLTEDPETLYRKSSEWQPYVETYTIPKMSYDVFHSLCLAKKVIVQVGNTKYELSSSTLTSLRDLDSTIAP